MPPVPGCHQCHQCERARDRVSRSDNTYSKSNKVHVLYACVCACHTYRGYRSSRTPPAAAAPAQRGRLSSVHDTIATTQVPKLIASVQEAASTRTSIRHNLCKAQHAGELWLCGSAQRSHSYSKAPCTRCGYQWPLHGPQFSGARQSSAGRAGVRHQVRLVPPVATLMQYSATVCMWVSVA